MNWFLLGLTSAIFAAIQFAIKSRLVRDKRLDSLVGFFTFLIAGLSLYIFYFLIGDKSLSLLNLSPRFWFLIFIHCLLEVVALLALFKAFRLADLSYLMPFLALASIGAIFPAWLFFGETLSWLGMLGVLLAISGVILIDYKKKIIKEEQKNKHWQAKIMMAIIFLAWSFTPSIRKEAIYLTSAATTAVILHFFIAFTFLIPFFLRKEYKIFSQKTRQLITWPKYFIIGLIGISIAAAISHINSYLALEVGLVAYAMALKETSAIFVVLISLLIFKERQNIKQKIIAIILTVIGAILIAI